MHNKSPKARRCAAGLTKTPFLFAPWLSRYTAKIMIKYISLIIVLFVSLTEQAYACKCAGPGNYDAIFEGKVLKIETDSKAINTEHYYTVYFKVEKSIKGIQKPEVIINTGPSLLCGVHYKSGMKYTVYAVFNKSLQTKYCYGKELQ